MATKDVRNLVKAMRAAGMTWKAISATLGYTGGWTTAWYLTHERPATPKFDPRLPEHYRV